MSKMKPERFTRFATLWERAATIYGSELTPEQIQAYARVLDDLPLEMIERALYNHMRDPERGRFMPRPADVLAQSTGETMGHPGPEEAWSVAQGATDEADTVVWTPEIAAAWGVALPSVQSGDMIGARVAFIEKYRRIMRDTRTEPRWEASLGHDPALRAARIQAASEAGRLAHDQADRLLLTSNASDHAQPGVNEALPAPEDEPPNKQRLRDYVNRILSGPSKWENARRKALEARRKREEQRRQQLLRQASGYAADRRSVARK